MVISYCNYSSTEYYSAHLFLLLSFSLLFLFFYIRSMTLYYPHECVASDNDLCYAGWHENYLCFVFSVLALIIQSKCK